MRRFPVALMCLVCLTVARASDEPKPRAEAAKNLLDAGTAKAQKENKAVFLSFGSPSCGWCKYLDNYHARPDVARVLERHLVFVKVDVVDNPGGQEMYEKYKAGDGGVPMWVVLSSGRAVLADSFNDKKNVGFPYRPDEVTHYEKVMRAALPKLTDAEVEVLLKGLKEAGPTKAK